MTPQFIVFLGPEGDPLATWCSVCGEIKEWVVDFLTDRTDITMCTDCVRAAGLALLDAAAARLDSQA